MIEKKHPLIEMVGIYKRFGKVEALRGVTFTVDHKEIVGLVGDNGAGKSTLIHILMGVYPADKGEFLFNGKKVQVASPAKARALGIEPVYQSYGLVDQASIYRNFFLGKEILRGVSPFKYLDKKKMKEITAKFLSDIGVSVKSVDIPSASLSGGERQAISIGRVMYFGSKLLILDEPTSSLSIKESEKVFSFIREARNRGLSIVIISHDLHMIYSVADRITVLNRGVVMGNFIKGRTSVSKLASMIRGKREVNSEKDININLKG